MIIFRGRYVRVHNYLFFRGYKCKIPWKFDMKIFNLKVSCHSAAKRHCSNWIPLQISTPISRQSMCSSMKFQLQFCRFGERQLKGGPFAWLVMAWRRLLSQVNLLIDLSSCCVQNFFGCFHRSDFAANFLFWVWVRVCPFCKMPWFGRWVGVSDLLLVLC